MELEAAEEVGATVLEVPLTRRTAVEAGMLDEIDEVLFVPLTASVVLLLRMWAVELTAVAFTA